MKYNMKRIMTIFFRRRVPNTRDRSKYDIITKPRVRIKQTCVLNVFSSLLLRMHDNELEAEDRTSFSSTDSNFSHERHGGIWPDMVVTHFISY